RFSADIKYRFGSNEYSAPSKKKAWQTPVIQALSASPANRDVRVHDKPISTTTDNV
ncbi:MAG: carbamoyl-phosphate synthase, partial [Synechococcus sp.]|nr:carbamoyl-phosphate synthase [Synechococcus sp.]